MHMALPMLKQPFFLHPALTGRPTKYTAKTFHHHRIEPEFFTSHHKGWFSQEFSLIRTPIELTFSKTSWNQCMRSWIQSVYTPLWVLIIFHSRTSRRETTSVSRYFIDFMVNVIASYINSSYDFYH